MSSTMFSVFTTALPGILSLASGVGGPQGEIVPQQLHDQGAVLVAVLVEGVQLGDGVIEGLLGELTRLVRAVEDLVVEHGEVEGESQPDGVSRLHLGLADFKCILIGLLGVIYNSYNLTPLEDTASARRLRDYLPFLSSPEATSDRYLK